MGHVIATAGKGGTGKTTLAALVVRHLLRLGKGPVLAIDADANDNLGDALGMRAPGSIASVTDEFIKGRDRLPAGMTREAFLEQRLNMVLAEGKGVDLLVMGHPEGAGCYCYINNVLRAQMEKLEASYPYIVVDNEAGLEHVSRRTARRIDTMLLVTDFSAKALRAAVRVGELARELEFASGKDRISSQPGAGGHFAAYRCDRAKRPAVVGRIAGGGGDRGRRSARRVGFQFAGERSGGGGGGTAGGAKDYRLTRRESMDERKKTVTLPCWNGQNVEVLGPDYEAGRPEQILRWEDKLADRKQRLAYLLTADRYWYATEGFGSEKRKNPA